MAVRQWEAGSIAQAETRGKALFFYQDCGKILGRLSILMVLLPLLCRELHAGQRSQNSHGSVCCSEQDSETLRNEIHGVLAILVETGKKHQTSENLQCTVGMSPKPPVSRCRCTCELR